MAENLYSKYRPLVFNQVVGHKKVVTELSKRAKDDNFNQAMLFSGFSGTGKTTIVNIIAKTILCEHKDKDGNPCNTCETCQSVILERQTPYYQIMNASNIGIDEMRGIETFVETKTLSLSKKKVVVIDELQEISGSKAQKNILKVLEKKYKDVYFLLLTMNDSKIDTAIKNRCIPYKLNTLDVNDIAEYLCSICDQEGINIDTKEKADVLITLAENSYGSMRTAISYLERVIYSELWDKTSVIEELSLVSNETLIDMLNKILQGDASFLNIKIEKDVVDRIRYVVTLYYKAMSGVKLNMWEQGQIRGLTKCPLESLEIVLSNLHEFLKFNYLTNELIDFTLIRICNTIKGMPKETIPRRR